MPPIPGTFADDVINLPARAQFEAFIDEHREALNHCLDGLTEEQARRSLVPSATTLLGLVKHATFLEKVWFDEAVTGRSRAEIGIPEASSESFILDGDDTIDTIARAHREACEASRGATASLGLDDEVYGYRLGPLPLRWVYLHVLRELAQHGGHADILREQILNGSPAGRLVSRASCVLSPDRARHEVAATFVVSIPRGLVYLAIQIAARTEEKYQADRCYDP
jgi:hypothetical protein